MGVLLKRNWFKLVAGFLILFVLALITWFLWWGTHRLPVDSRAPEFSLTSIDGNKTVSLDSLDGKVKVVSFIYTNCPDACPLTMHSMMEVQNELKQAGLFGDKVELLTVTMDPKNDSADVLRKYGDMFHRDPSGWEMLRTDEADTDKMLTGFKITPDRESNGLITHSNKVFLIDGNRNIRTYYDLTDDDHVADIVSDLKNLVHEHGFAPWQS